MTSFEDVARVWAAKRLDLDVRDIKAVEFESEEGYSYSEYTEEPGYYYAEVTLVDPALAALTAGRFTVTAYDYTDLLEELVKTGIEIAGQPIQPPRATQENHGNHH